MSMYVTHSSQPKVYSDLLEHVHSTIQNYRLVNYQSPSIIQLAEMLGEDEETILECLEFGRTSPESRTFH
ncbi:hypothetical protein [Alkalihalobacillus pseudalcaliphilus]|uniref:hypothetical protein n=1 Tax=Alkalihalobacillus pseudalcaliphilus TaxID=79884 RepID=UPI002361A7CD|nr:hypothetical protein [Alkalihalobacillus pseudalcaliphilus]